MQDSARVTKQCPHARAAIETARAGAAHIRELRPGGCLALFMTVGLVATVRAIFHALYHADSKLSVHHKEVISGWKAQELAELRRYQLIVQKARDLLIKEWYAIPVTTGEGAQSSAHDYAIVSFIPSTDRAEQVLTAEEKSDRELTILVAGFQDIDPDWIRSHIRVDVLHECEVALRIWEAQIAIIEETIQSVILAQCGAQ